MDIGIILAIIILWPIIGIVLYLKFEIIQYLMFRKTEDSGYDVHIEYSQFKELLKVSALFGPLFIFMYVYLLFMEIKTRFLAPAFIKLDKYLEKCYNKTFLAKK